MHKIPHYLCGAIPPHMMNHLADQPAGRGAIARLTIERMDAIAAERARALTGSPEAAAREAAIPRKQRNVYDAKHRFGLPGKLVRKEGDRRRRDIEVNEAYDGTGAMYDFHARVFNRSSIDGRGMRLDCTVHYGQGFANAVWTGEQIVFGDGDGEIFRRFTASLDVIGHEWAHGFTQHTAALDYSGETGALNEHISDVVGIMLKQWMLGQSAGESDWLIGAGLFTPKVNARGIRSMAAPGTAYDDPILGRDPQPAHMRDYVDTDEDNGGVHINSGIPNRAFCLSAKRVGGRVHEKVGRVWHLAVKERLDPDATFHDLARATTDIAGEQFGNGKGVQQAIAAGWSEVGIEVPLFAHRVFYSSPGNRRRGPAASSLSPRRQCA